MKKLTKQECVIAEMVARGFSEKEIATKLFIAVTTVHTHTKNIRMKIAARSAVDVARYFILENPMKFFGVLLFLFLQTTIVFSNQNFELRKQKMARRTFKTRNYV